MTPLRLGPRAARTLGTLFGLLLIALLLLRLRSLWSEHPIPIEEANKQLLAAAVVGSGLAMTVYGAIWPATLRSIGTAPPSGLPTTSVSFAGWLYFDHRAKTGRRHSRAS